MDNELKKSNEKIEMINETEKNITKLFDGKKWKLPGHKEAMNKIKQFIIEYKKNVLLENQDLKYINKIINE